MANRLKNSEIEKILTNFDDSDISDESEKSELISNLYNAFENNNSFLVEELSREGPYEIILQDINVDNDNDAGDGIIEIEERLAGEVTVQESPIISETPRGPHKKAAQFRWKKR